MQASFRKWQCSDRYIIYLFPHLYLPVPSKPYGFCRCKVPQKKKYNTHILIYNTHILIYNTHILPHILIYNSHILIYNTHILIYNVYVSLKGHTKHRCKLARKHRDSDNLPWHSATTETQNSAPTKQQCQWQLIMTYCSCQDAWFHTHKVTTVKTVQHHTVSTEHWPWPTAAAETLDSVPMK